MERLPDFYDKNEENSINKLGQKIKGDIHSITARDYDEFVIKQGRKGICY